MSVACRVESVTDLEDFPGRLARALEARDAYPVIRLIYLGAPHSTTAVLRVMASSSEAAEAVARAGVLSAVRDIARDVLGDTDVGWSTHANAVLASSSFGAD